MPRQPNYAASKAAIELGKHDIQANAIVPGWIETDMNAPAMAWKKVHDAIVSRTPAGRWGKPEEFEAVAVHLASRESRLLPQRRRAPRRRRLLHLLAAHANWKPT